MRRSTGSLDNSRASRAAWRAVISRVARWCSTTSVSPTWRGANARWPRMSIAETTDRTDRSQIVMNAAAVEGERGVPKQQRRRHVDHAPVKAWLRRRQRGGSRRRESPIDNVVNLLNDRLILDVERVLHLDEDESA